MDLNKYVEKYNINVAKFCRVHGLNKTTFERVRKGYNTQISTANRIEKATEGLVTVSDIISGIAKEPQKDKADIQ